MADLLTFWVEKLRETGVPLAELGGDRKRYNRFGRETAGREYTYTFTERMFSERSVDGADVR